MGSESKQSFIGSFLQPPDKMFVPTFGQSKSKKATATTGDMLPAPNNQALMSALKTLQEKIRHLELERSQAEDNLSFLSIEAAQYKKTLQHETNEKDLAHEELIQQKKDVSVQLSAAQSRCSLLEKQLDYMRKMVFNAELEKNMVLEQQTQLQKEKDRNQMELHAKLEKLEVLEKECFRFSTTQRTAEDKIKQLEEKLCEEEHQRKLIEDKAAQLQTGLEINRILMSSVSPQNEPKKKNQKKKTAKKKSALKKVHPPQFCLNAGMLPFVAGKSASSSHSVSANVQSVLHMMKHRSPCVLSRCPEAAEHRISRRTIACKSVSSCSTSSVTENLSDLLLAIQDELGQMSFEHQELSKQIQETQNCEVREDLERELDCLVKQMEIKGEQISKLKKHQASVHKLKQKAQKLKRQSAHVLPKSDDLKETREIPVTSSGRASKSCPVQKSKSSLQLLKNVQKLQSTLKKDDIMWEQ
ncbi:centrosomal protein CEP57L1 isoform X1 [Dermochelys coriacea]|uniref:centrosomal protein CEP57L1 isoform X1 n=1 Tax=Dermochelys coriacea TaxID=27794 RepID=UPI0018E8F290|nr:centrosomal protein CEP57L1 isoform X1 [Dermochelys coriacea]XP_038253492.1 centrosomal protein CEP57L1 isoform X1 [Dermochelys coriacea]XP_038253493.1 centrosomal protein CEP57L1 isoform X1 [Dermochelys coriacea]XP_038253494.1 centrosomal protein CEP57L1 isoform X1 [Dermochelys coriacea]XP_038253495.1 centrosomal protein CEP57L1 isoform X1 [Dermochelys coriacea]XP_043366721.1 centrosomal protein CEP57L1 isoform X1 [Dermochelys coriacea]